MLCDPDLLRLHEDVSQRQMAGLPTKSAGREITQHTARAMGREQAAGLRLEQSMQALALFEEHRQDMPLVYRELDGELQVATLRQVQPREQTLVERMISFSTETEAERHRRMAVEQSALDRHQQLVTEREQAGSFYEAAREIMEQSRVQHETLQPENDLPMPHYTAKEIAQMETFAEKQPDEELLKVYETVIHEALASGRVGFQKLDGSDHTDQPDEGAPQQGNAHVVVFAENQAKQHHAHDHGQGVSM